MTASTLARAVLLPFVLFALVACGGGFTEGDVEQFGSFRIDVTNETFPTGAVVHLVPADEDPRELGDAPVEATTTFRIEPEDPTVQHRLRAVVTGGEEIVSDPFVPAESRGLSWDVGTNVLTLEEDGGAADAGDANGA